MNANSHVLSSAQDLAEREVTWADLFNSLFSPEDGVLSQAFETKEARRSFVRSPEYKQIRQLLIHAMQRDGVAGGATPEKSGKFVVRLPKSLHAALDTEAAQEGTSLNQLVLTKLAVQLHNLADSPVALVHQAFLEVRSGYSSDRVIADPKLDQRFLRRCREFGLSLPDVELNWMLMGARKDKTFAKVGKTKRYTVREADKIEYASEMALRYIQRCLVAELGKELTLDRIICDPELAADFDAAAIRLSPGFAPLDYRWVALSLRKARRLSPGSANVELPNLETIGRIRSVRASAVPDEQGVYVLRNDDDAIFVGETVNLRERYERHIEYGGADGVPDWLFEVKKKPVSISLAALPRASAGMLRAIELGFIRRLHPVFNYLNKKFKAA